MKVLNKKTLISTLIATSLITGCSSDSKKQEAVSYDYAAVVQTKAPDYSSSNVQLIDLSEKTLTPSSGLIPKVKSDYMVSAYEDNFYHIGRYKIDVISRHNIADASSKLYEYSAKDNIEDTSANVHDMVFVNDTKAYIINFGNSKIWIVNPKAETEAEFKLGELDLSAYEDADGIPEADSAIIVDGKLFVAMQRLNRNAGWTPVAEGVPAYVAVFDTATDKEIDTNTKDEATNPKGIKLNTRNPRQFSYHPSVGLLLASSGDAGSSYSKRDPSYVGGITKINTNDYSITMVVDDGDDKDHPYGNIRRVTILDSENGYFSGETKYNVNTLYHFNPSTGAVTGAVEKLKDVDIGSLVTGPLGRAWVGVYSADNPRILLLNTAQEEVAEIKLTQNPDYIAFTRAVKTDKKDKAQEGQAKEEAAKKEDTINKDSTQSVNLVKAP